MKTRWALSKGAGPPREGAGNSPGPGPETSQFGRDRHGRGTRATRAGGGPRRADRMLQPHHRNIDPRRRELIATTTARTGTGGTEIRSRTGRHTTPIKTSTTRAARAAAITIAAGRRPASLWWDRPRRPCAGVRLRHEPVTAPSFDVACNAGCATRAPATVPRKPRGVRACRAARPRRPAPPIRSSMHVSDARSPGCPRPPLPQGTSTRRSPAAIGSSAWPVRGSGRRRRRCRRRSTPHSHQRTLRPPAEPRRAARPPGHDCASPAL